MTVLTQLAPAYDPSLTGAIQVFLPTEGDCFSLPKDVTKAEAVRNAEAALRRLGASSTAILVFRMLADTTRRSAWHSTDEAAVNFRRQADMAHEAGIGERQFRRLEASLQAFGMIARTTAANGYRGRRSGTVGPIAGISLEPCIANHDGIVSILREAETAERIRQETRLRASIARRRLGQFVAAVADPEQRKEFAEWREGTDRRLRPSCVRSASKESLDAWLAGIVELERRVAAAAPEPAVVAPPSGTAAEPGGTDTDPVESSGSERAENTPVQVNISGAPDIGDRRHIQPTTGTGYESCNPGGSGIHEREARATTSPAAAAIEDDGGPGDLLGPKLLARLSARSLRSLASADAALYLDAFADWRDAIPLILNELGIAAGAYEEAVEVMGHTAAFVALLVIDRNRFHPTNPIRSPGGALRAFTRLASRGRLNLARSVVGIWERERAGRQPRERASPAHVLPSTPHP